MSKNLAHAVALTAVAGALAFVMTAVPASAQNLARYRDFALGADLPSIAALVGVAPTTATTVHARPVVMQELQWRRPYAAEPDAVQQIVFSFYDNQLSTMVVDYDRDRTAGQGRSSPDGERRTTRSRCTGRRTRLDSASSWRRRVSKRSRAPPSRSRTGWTPATHPASKSRGRKKKQKTFARRKRRRASPIRRRSKGKTNLE